jgi:hypothetical protein
MGIGGRGRSHRDQHRSSVGNHTGGAARAGAGDARGKGLGKRHVVTDRWARRARGQTVAGCVNGSAWVQPVSQEKISEIRLSLFNKHRLKINSKEISRSI